MLWSPLVLPWLVWPLYEPAFAVLPQWATALLEVFVFSPVIAGIPYFVFALVATRWLRSRTMREHRWLLWRAPLFFVPVFAIYFIALQFVQALFSDPWPWFAASLELVGRFSVYVLVLGYAYVLATVGLHRMVCCRRA